MKKRSLTGIRPSGSPHLGNYLGAIRPALARQTDYECFYFIADLHALTTVKNKEALRRGIFDLLATWLALGFDHTQHIIYCQSDIPIVTELAWYLSCCTGVGFLEKAHAYKDAASQKSEVNHGVFAYPVLMAADILLYDPDFVPVGKDQVQHVEMARDMAGSFNAIFGENILKLPAALVDEKVMLIPGLDGRKMSKSYGNEIAIFADEKTLRKQVLSIKTDSTALEDPKVLHGTLVGELFSLFAPEDQFKDLESRLRAGGLGWGHAKEELFQLINSHLAASREKYVQLREDEKALEEILENGRLRALAVAKPIINRVRQAIGLRMGRYD